MTWPDWLMKLATGGQINLSEEGVGGKLKLTGRGACLLSSEIAAAPRLMFWKKGIVPSHMQITLFRNFWIIFRYCGLYP